MFKLPLCPHCGTRFFYDDVKKTVKEKKGKCPNCKKKFTVSYKLGYVLLFVFVVITAILLNLLLLKMGVQTLWVLLIADAIYLVIAYLLRFYTVKYRIPQDKT